MELYKIDSHLIKLTAVTTSFMNEPNSLSDVQLTKLSQSIALLNALATLRHSVVKRRLDPRP